MPPIASSTIERSGKGATACRRVTE